MMGVMDAKKVQAKMLIIGIDSATFDLIDPWVREGLLPGFQRLAESGVRAPLAATVPPLTPPSWSTFMTGKNPGKHGIYDFYRLNDRFENSVVTALDRKDKTIWHYLSDAGKRCIVMQVPFTYPPQRVNGLLISDFTTPGTDVAFTYPAEFKAELLQRFPSYSFSEKTKYSEKESDRQAYLDEILSMTATQWDVVHWLREEKPWDFFMVTLMGVDHVQHWYWKYMDGQHPLHDPGEKKKFGDAILRVYQLMDQHLIKLLDNLDDQTRLIVMSDHGAGPYLQNVSLNNWLRKKGYLALKATPAVWFKRLLNALSIHPTSLAKLAFWLGFASKAGEGRKTGAKKGWMKKLIFSYEDIDWKKTVAYSFGYYGAIYLNSKQRSLRNGIVDDADYEPLRERLIQDLRSFKEPKTGEGIVTQLWKREELYHGEQVGRLPDLIFAMKDYAYASSSMFAFSSNKIFSPALTQKTGEHRPIGIFYCAGAGIAKGKVLNEIQMQDLAPSILDYFGLSVPSDMDGRVVAMKEEKG